MGLTNSQIIGQVFKGTNAYQLGAPNPEQVGIAKAFRWINDPMNNEWRNNTFIPELFKLVGTQIIRSQEWTNPLAPFKRVTLNNMKAIQEVQGRLIKGRSYSHMSHDQAKLLEYNPPEFEVALHTVDRKVCYPITYNQYELEQSFLTEGGLSQFFSAVMQIPVNSDNRDEYEAMVDLIAKYEDKWGFFNVQVPDMANPTEDDVKALLEAIRTYAEKLKFYKPYYNAYKMEVFTPKDQLILITTPEIKAKMDVRALAAAFNVEYAQVENRMVIVDEIPIKDCYALLVDENWFVCGDALFQTTSFVNGATLNTNYWFHHWEVLSVSPMLNCLKFTKNATSPLQTVDVTPEKNDANLYVSIGGTANDAYLDKDFVATDSTTYVDLFDDEYNTVAVSGSVALAVDPAGAIDDEFKPIDFVINRASYVTKTGEGESVAYEVNDVKLNARTYIDKFGAVHLQKELESVLNDNRGENQNDDAIENGIVLNITGTTTYNTDGVGDKIAPVSSSINVHIYRAEA